MGFAAGRKTNGFGRGWVEVRRRGEGRDTEDSIKDVMRGL